jgi:hypothetical protein
MVLEGVDDSGPEGANGGSDDSMCSEGERKVTYLKKERSDSGAVEFGQFWRTNSFRILSEYALSERLCYNSLPTKHF